MRISSIQKSISIFQRIRCNNTLHTGRRAAALSSLSVSTFVSDNIDDGHQKRSMGQTRLSSTNTNANTNTSTNTNTNTNNEETPPMETTHFGFKNVNMHEKEDHVKEVFNSVAESYDVMNDFMSVGLHRLWKDEFVKQTCVESIARSVVRRHRHNSTTTTKTTTSSSANNNKEEAASSTTTEEFRMLDVAGGTGDIAFRLINAAQCYERSKSSGNDPISVTVCDINTEMLKVGERRANTIYGKGTILNEQHSTTNNNNNSTSSNALSFVEGNAQALDNFHDHHFDLYTIAFGLRNVTNIDMALSEALRVLKPGGKYMCLEFSHVTNPLFKAIYDTYSFNVIPTIGHYVANDKPSYQYLVESIRKHPTQEQLQAKMEHAGFQSVKYTNYTGGIVAIHEGYKPIS